MELMNLSVIKDQPFFGTFSFNNSSTNLPADTFTAAKLTYGDPDSAGIPVWVQPGITYIYPNITVSPTTVWPTYPMPVSEPFPDPTREQADWIQRFKEMQAETQRVEEPQRVNPEAIRQLEEMLNRMKEMVRKAVEEKQQAAPEPTQPEQPEEDDAEIDTARFRRI